MTNEILCFQSISAAISRWTGRCLLDLDADDPCVTCDVKVLVLDFSHAVGEVHHGAVRELDVKLLHVEVDVKLTKTKTQNTIHPLVSVMFYALTEQNDWIDWSSIFSRIVKVRLFISF